MRPAVACVALLACAGPALADILPPGHRPVNHVLRFENLADHPDYAFYLVTFGRSYAKGEEPERVTAVPVPASGETMAPPSRSGMIGHESFLYAVPTKLVGGLGASAEGWASNPPAGVLKSGQVASHVRAIPEGDPRRQVVTGYRIDVAGGELRLTETAGAADGGAHSSAESVAPRWVIAGGLALAALVVALGLVWVRGRKSSD